MSYLIKDTTEDERRKIVEDALGCLDGACDGCAVGVADMYDVYIRGEREIEEINRAFSTQQDEESEGEEDIHSPCLRFQR